MTRVRNRVGELAFFFLSLRGVLIIAAFGSGLLAILLEGPRLWLGIVSLALWALILSLASLRQAEMNVAVRDLRREVASVRRTSPMGGLIRQVRPSPYGPSGRGELALAYAAAKIDRVRGQLALPRERQQRRRKTLEDRGETGSGPFDPLVTVIVPCYNDERFIVDCLESVRGQVFEDWECIVVDDGSIDSSPSLIARIVESDDRFRFVRHGVNAGLPAARNTGLRLASGDLVAFLDADDLLRPDSLLDRVEALSDHWADGSIAGSFSGVAVGSEVTSLEDLGPSEEWTSSRDFVDFINGSADCPFPVLSPIVRRRVVVGVGGFDESLTNGGEDWDLWLRILRAGFVFVPSSLRGAVYRQRLESMAKRHASDHVRQSAVLTESAFSPHPAPIALARSYAFDRSLEYYERALHVGRRAIRSAGMALMNGDREEAVACLDVLEPNSWGWLDRHLDVEATAADGIRRGLGLNAEQLDELRDSISSFVSEIVEQVNQRTAGERLPTDSSDRIEVEMLLAPQNRAQLEAMLAAYARSAGGEDGSGVGILNVDRLAGDQAVAIAITSSRLQAWSLNEWWLGQGKLKTLVVPSVRDATLEALVALGIKSGARVVEFREPGADIMRVIERSESYLSLDESHDEPPGHVPLQIDRTSSFGGGALDDVLAPESIWRLEERASLKSDGTDIDRFRNLHHGERVVIVGNGPSLNQTDLRKLEGTPSIGVNAIFLATDDIGFKPHYYVVEDTAVVRDNLERIRGYLSPEHRFFPSIYRDAIGESSKTSYFNMNTGFYEKRSPAYGVPRFSTDASLRLFAGQSVTIINLQLAYFMGFSEVILIGMDFSYSVPEDSVVEGNRILSMGDDPNHFHPDYFGKGKVWKDPKLDRVLANYQLAKLMFESDGRRILNATPGGKLELFDRVDFDDLF